MNPKVLPAFYFHTEFKEGIKLDGSPDGEDGPLVGNEPNGWFVVSSQSASLYTIATFPEEWIPKLARALYVDDSRKVTEAGLYFGDMAGLLTKGLHVYSIRMYFFPKEFKWGDQLKVPQIAGRELEVRSKPWQ